MEIVKDINATVAYVALDFEAEKKRCHMTPFEKGRSWANRYELPDGRAIQLNEESFYCPEMLFNTKRSHLGPLPCREAGVHELVHNAVTACNNNLRKRMYNNIVVCGGSSALKGLPERLTAEVAKLIPTEPIIPRLIALQGLSAVHGGAFRELGYLRRHVGSFFSWVRPTDCRCINHSPLYAVWIGGSVLSSLSSFQSQWITREQFDDVGPNIVHHRLCR